MVDIEMLRIEKLIEEREAYENAFFSMEYDDVEFNYTISQLDNSQEFIVEVCGYDEILIEPEEEYIGKLRDEKLIKEREAYEIQYFKNFTYEPIEMDFLDHVIKSYEEPEPPEPDFTMNDYFFEDYFDNTPVVEPVSSKPLCYWDEMDYMPNDDFYEDVYYYPDGDLLGIYPL